MSHCPQYISIALLCALALSCEDDPVKVGATTPESTSDSTIDNSTEKPWGMAQYLPMSFSIGRVGLFGRVYGAVSTRVDYGLTTEYGMTITAHSADTVDVILANLAPGETYHWRIVGWNKWGTLTGPDYAFTLPLSVKPFNFPLKIGTVWRYSCIKYSNSDYHGTHTWTVKSSGRIGNWTCMDVRVDSLLTQQQGFDSLEFIIRELPDYYQVEFPEWLGERFPTRRVPRWIDEALDTLRYFQSLPGGVTGWEQTTMVRGIGIMVYSAREPWMTGAYAYLRLRDSWIPEN